MYGKSAVMVFDALSDFGLYENMPLGTAGDMAVIDRHRVLHLIDGVPGEGR